MGRLFNGTSDYLKSGVSIDLTAYNKLILTCWMWIDAYTNNDNCAFEFGDILSQQGTFFVNPDNSSNSKMDLFVKGDVGFNAVSYTRPSTGVWHHCAFVFDFTQSGQEVDYHLDGTLQTPTSTIFTSNNTGNFGNYTLYFMTNVGQTRFLAGRLAEVALYNGNAVSVNEIVSLSKAYAPRMVRLSTMSAYWPLLTKASPEIELIQGNGATVTGASVTDHPLILYPSPLSFENYNSIISKTLTLAGTAGFTLSPNNVLGVTDTFTETAGFTLTPNNVISLSDAESATNTFSLAVSNSIPVSETLAETATFALTPNNVVSTSNTLDETANFTITPGNDVNPNINFSDTGGFTLTPNNVISVADSENSVNDLIVTPGTIIGLSNTLTETANIILTPGTVISVSNTLSESANFTLTPNNSILSNLNFSYTGGFTLSPNNVLTVELVFNKSTGIIFATRQPALRVYDRIKESSTSTGTGNFVLQGAQSGGYFTFAAKIAIGIQFPYVIQNTSLNQVEIGIGHLMTNTLLIRDQVQVSTNSNNPVDFSPGVKDVMVVLPTFYAGVFQEAGDMVIVDNNGIPQRLEAGPEGSTLQIVNGLPGWV